MFSEANRDGTDAESPFLLFFSFSASFKNSSLREKVAKLSSFWDWWVESLFVSIIVANGQQPCLAAGSFTDFTEISGLEPKFL